MRGLAAQRNAFPFLETGVLSVKENGKAAGIARYVLCYGLAATLLVYYLVILYLGMHPQVDERYRAFYIDRLITVWPGDSSAEIVPGQAFHYEEKGDGAWLKGFTYEEGVGYGITSWDSSMIFFGEPGRSYQGSITLSAPQPGGEVTLFVNGEQVAFQKFPEAEQTITFETPPLAEDGQLLLRIVLGGGLEVPVRVEEVVLS